MLRLGDPSMDEWLVALAAASEKALRRPVLSPTERAARHHALADRFSIDRTFEQIFALYQRLIDENRRKRAAVPQPAPSAVGDPSGAR